MNIGEVLMDVLYQLLEGTVSLFPPFHAHNPFTSHHQQVFLIRIEITRAPLSFQFSAIPGGVVCSSGIEQIEEVLEITVVPKRNVKSTIISLIQLIVIELPICYLWILIDQTNEKDIISSADFNQPALLHRSSCDGHSRGSYGRYCTGRKE